MEEALTALLASVAGGRRYWGRGPQTASRPFLVLNKISGVRDYTMSAPSGYVAGRVQVDCYADTYTSALATKRAVVDAVSGHKDTGSGAIIQGIFADDTGSLPVADAGDVTNLFRISLDLLIHYAE